MTYLSVKHVTKTFHSGGDAVLAIQGVHIELEKGEVVTILGPSGCGKSTLLRCIAGLEEPDSGLITLDGQVLYERDIGQSRARLHVPPYERAMAMIFQSYALWPHMTVHGNIAFPLRYGRNRLSRADTQARVDSALKLVGMQSYADRPIYALSGGQQQRVALARALALRPKVLLLDEPLSNLDQQLRIQTRREVRALIKEIGLTAINVTHDQSEAMAMSDRIAVMHEGRVLQFDAPAVIHEAPASRAVAEFLGHMNIVSGRISSITAEHVQVDTGVGPIQVSRWDRSGLWQVDTLCSVGIKALAVTVSAARLPGANVIAASIARSEFLGDDQVVECRVPNAGDLIRARLRAGGAGDEVLSAGTPVFVAFPPDQCVLMDAGV